MPYGVNPETGLIDPDNSYGSQAVAALEIIWDAITDLHPGLGPAMIRLDTLPRRTGYVHVAPEAITLSDGTRLHDIRVRDVVTQLAPWDRIMIMLHAAVHVECWQQHLPDKRNRQHTDNFRRIAHDYGLTTVWTDQHGWTTQLPARAPARRQYRPVAWTLARHTEPPANHAHPRVMLNGQHGINERNTK